MRRLFKEYKGPAPKKQGPINEDVYNTFKKNNSC
jgi:hypothetical protein